MYMQPKYTVAAPIRADTDNSLSAKSAYGAVSHAPYASRKISFIY